MPHQQRFDSGRPDPFAPLTEGLAYYMGNFKRNTIGSVAHMDTKNWLRLIAIVGGYLLVRPYVVKWGIDHQKAQLEKEGRKTEEERKAAAAANALRGISGEESDEDEVVDEGDAADIKVDGEPNWGRRARVRQRKNIKKVLDEREKRALMEDWSDEDVSDLLDGSRN